MPVNVCVSAWLCMCLRELCIAAVWQRIGFLGALGSCIHTLSQICGENAVEAEKVSDNIMAATSKQVPPDPAVLLQD